MKMRMMTMQLIAMLSLMLRCGGAVWRKENAARDLDIAEEAQWERKGVLACQIL